MSTIDQALQGKHLAQRLTNKSSWAVALRALDSQAIDAPIASNEEADHLSCRRLHGLLRAIQPSRELLSTLTWISQHDSTRNFVTLTATLTYDTGDKESFSVFNNCGELSCRVYSQASGYWSEVDSRMYQALIAPRYPWYLKVQ